MDRTDGSTLPLGAANPLPVAICPGVDRAVAFADGELFVLALPSGRRERTIPFVAGEFATLVCAPGGRHVALVSNQDVYLVSIAEGASPAARTTAGTDATTPMLAPDDEHYVDPKCKTDKPRCGFGWASRCYDHLVHGAWGYARAACDKAIALDPKDPETRRMTFYNAGRVAEQGKDITRARTLYTQSLAIREVAEVRAHLKNLPK